MGKELSDDEYKSVLIEIVKDVDDFCRRNGICYYMLGGTMLGAVRHKGFIPWDDDIDIGMPREDYELFCKEYCSNNSRYKVLYINNDDDYYLPAAKVVDNRISLYEDILNAPEIGAYIDVFPLDYVELDTNGTCSYFKNKLVFRMQKLKYVNVNENRSLIKNMIIVLNRIIYPLSLHKIAIDKEKKARKCSKNYDTGWIANLHGAWGEKELVKSSYFSDGEDYSFENLILRGPKDYDSYLKSLYGDYMKLPPIEKRVTHHGFTALWKD